MKFVSFRLFSKSRIIFFIPPIFYLIRYSSQYMLYFLGAESGFINHPLLWTALMFIGEILCGIFQLFSKFNEKVDDYLSKAAITSNKKDEKKKIFSDNPNENKKITFLLIFANAFYDCFAYLLILILTANKNYKSTNLLSETLITEMFFVFIVTIFVVKLPVYRHHILGLILVGVGLIILSIYRFANEQIKLSVLWLILIHLFYPLKHFSDKFLMESRFYTPSRLLFFEGIFGFGICILLVLSGSFINCPDFMGDFCSSDKIFDFRMILMIFKRSGSARGFNLKVRIIMLLWVFQSMGYNLFVMLIKDRFSPLHKSINDSLCAVFSWVNLMIFLGSSPCIQTTFGMTIVGYLLIIIGPLVSNEFVIIHFCKLDEEVEESVTKRSLYESQDVNIDIEEVLNKN